MPLQQKLLGVRRDCPGDAKTSESDLAEDSIERDPWLASVIRSPGLRNLRQTALWWQRFQLESSCLYTSRLMKRPGCFESYLTAHFAAHPAPPAVEELATALASLCANPNLVDTVCD